MFEYMGDRISNAIKNIKGMGKITEENISDAMREIRMALLEADVNYEVVKEFIKKSTNEFEVYINGNVIFGKKITGTNIEKKEEYYYCKLDPQINFPMLNETKDNSSSDFFEEYVFLYLEKYSCLKEQFDEELEKWKKEQESKKLCKIKKN